MDPPGLVLDPSTIPHPAPRRHFWETLSAAASSVLRNLNFLSSCAGASCQRAPGPSRCPMRRPCSRAPRSAPCTPEACQPHPRAVRAGPPPPSQTSRSPRGRPQPGATAGTQTFPEKEVIGSSVQKTSLNCDLFTLRSWSRSNCLGLTRRPSASRADDQPLWRHPFPSLA